MGALRRSFAVAMMDCLRSMRFLIAIVWSREVNGERRHLANAISASQMRNPTLRGERQRKLSAEVVAIDVVMTKRCSANIANRSTTSLSHSEDKRSPALPQLCPSARPSQNGTPRWSTASLRSEPAALSPYGDHAPASSPVRRANLSDFNLIYNNLYAIYFG